MGQSLREIAQQLKDANKKVQLIYAFNGTGKTRLSREFKELIAPKRTETAEEDESGVKILYYNAFTEDLFYWDNDLDADIDRKLKIQPNNFTDWVLRDQGQDTNIITHFQHYTSDKLTPLFSEDFSEVRFSFERGNDERPENVKISKGEESCFIWSIFYSFLEQIINVLNVAETDERETNQFNDLKYVFIDDPVSSLDDNHLIELAVNVAELIKSSKSDLKFIVTTHNPLFYNVLFNETGNKTCYMLHKFDDGTYDLPEKKGDSNKSFSYHLFLMQTIEEAINTNNIQKYHFTLLRNLYEKTANFLGYPRWSDLLPDDKQAYYNRVIQITSHSTLSNEVVPEPTEPEKQTVKFLLEHLVNNKYWKENATI
ncbi:hypothetical protein EZS27_019712 [termite gut metagenome]|uniref:Protein CR006 P-loop domain-containing protein n=1 Tax=termite gut metagenome TaxID=433724 RepID=A0A5J4RCB0_9ZZZZ